MPKVTYKLDDDTAAQIAALGVPLDGFIEIAVQEKLARETGVEPPPRIIGLPDGTQVVTNVSAGQPYVIPLEGDAPSGGADAGPRQSRQQRPDPHTATEPPS